MTRKRQMRSEDELSNDLDRPDAEEQAWQMRAIRESLEDYLSGHAELVPHEQAMAQIEAKIQEKMSRASQ